MTRKSLLLIIVALCVASLAGAFFFQYVVGILPCHLCLLQRYPPAIMAGLALLSLAPFGRRLPLAGAAVALWSIGLAVYHSGVERKFWAGPDDCTGGQNLSGLSGADLLSTDIASPIIRCDEISFHVLGVTFANANVIVSLVLLALWIAAARKS